MARLRRKGPASTKLVRDDDGTPMPIMAWGQVHALAPTETTAARNAVALSPETGVVSIIAIGGAAHFKQGDDGVVATTSDPFLPEGEWLELPLLDGTAFDYISIVAAPGAGTISAQICERR